MHIYDGTNTIHYIRKLYTVKELPLYFHHDDKICQAYKKETVSCSGKSNLKMLTLTMDKK
jgi:hypothetical protein